MTRTELMRRVRENMTNNEKTNEAYVRSLPDYAKVAELIVPFFEASIRKRGAPVGRYKNFDAEELFHSWMVRENPGLANMMPLTMILMGRGKKLLQFVEGALNENIR